MSDSTKGGGILRVVMFSQILHECKGKKLSDRSLHAEGTFLNVWFNPNAPKKNGFFNKTVLSLVLS